MSSTALWSLLKDLPNGNLSGHARLRLHRNARLVTAATMLAAFPAMALVSGDPIAVVASLVLFGILPAAVAMDVRRPARLDRAVIINLCIIAAVLAGGVLRGLPLVSAVSLLALVGIEATLIVSRRQRRPALGMVAVGMLAFALAALSAPIPAGTEMPAVWSAALAAVATVINTAMLLHGTLAGLSATSHRLREQSIQSLEVEQMVSECVVAIDTHGSVVRVSNNTDRVLGLTVDALKGRGLAEMVLVADRPLLLSAISHAAHAQENGTAKCGRTYRLRLRTASTDQSPSYRWIAFGVSPSLSAPHAVIATLRDIDEQVREEEHLVKAALEAETAKKARGAFLSTVNHELRTPLNAIVGFSEILANPETLPSSPERVKEYAGIINGAGQDLLRMVTSMIDITKLDSGVYDFDPEMTTLMPLVQSAADAFRDNLGSNAPTIVLSAPDDTIAVHADARALRSVLMQLLSNATKFNKAEGKISIKIGQERDWITVAVCDQGPGIARDKLDQLGRNFARIDETLGREHGGIGLGLALSRGLMSLHGGLIGIDSSLGKGTTVTLSLPRQEVRPDQLANIHPMVQPAAAPKAMNDVQTPERRRA
jgi:two-component system, cell cycle sensor histidine kinase DivJ